jgi:hypothetical protein
VPGVGLKIDWVCPQTRTRPQVQDKNHGASMPPQTAKVDGTTDVS